MIQTSQIELSQPKVETKKVSSKQKASSKQKVSEVVGLIKHFETMADPRAKEKICHELIDIIVIAICAILCGAEHWTEVEEFGEAKEEWLRTFLKLPGGIPSHDVFTDVFRCLDPVTFQNCFENWMKEASQVLPGEVIAIDGKCLRGSHDKGIGKGAIRMVSAWACQQRLVLGQRKVDEKSNEITAIPELLEVLAIGGCVVTIDAMGCQKEIVEIIVGKGADYVIALKKNQGNLYEDVEAAFRYGEESKFAHHECDYCQEISKGHGRIEIRECWVMPVSPWRDYIRHADDWKEWNTMVKIIDTRIMAGKTSREIRYFISSLYCQAPTHLKTVRSHWSIENSLHWTLDVSFNEDECRVRAGYGDQNFATLRHVALNLLRQDTKTKVGIHGKRLKAGWDEAYLLQLLAELA